MRGAGEPRRLCDIISQSTHATRPPASSLPPSLPPCRRAAVALCVGGAWLACALLVIQPLGARVRHITGASIREALEEAPATARADGPPPQKIRLRVWNLLETHPMVVYFVEVRWTARVV
jgi:hypothetical protein